MKKFLALLATAGLVLSTPFFLRGVLLFFSETVFTLEKIKFFFFGALLAVLLIRFTSLLQFVYILFHEISHALAGVLCSANFFSFSVKKDFGYVTSDKSNLFIRLSPYLFPLLPFLILAVHFLVSIYYRYHENYFTSFKLTFLLIGIFYTSTSYYNLKLLLKETSDVDRNALFVSFLLIFNCYFISSAFLAYSLFNSELLLERYYFL